MCIRCSYAPVSQAVRGVNPHKEDTWYGMVLCGGGVHVGEQWSRKGRGTMCMKKF